MGKAQLWEIPNHSDFDIASKTTVRILMLIYSYDYKLIDIVRVYFGIHYFKQIMLRELAARSLSYTQVPHSLVWGKLARSWHCIVAIDSQSRFCWQNQNHLYLEFSSRQYAVAGMVGGTKCIATKYELARCMNGNHCTKNYLKINLTTS